MAFIYKPHFGAPKEGGWREIIFKANLLNRLFFGLDAVNKHQFLLKLMFVFCFFSVAIVIITLPSCTCHGRSINSGNGFADVRIIHLESTLVLEAHRDAFSGADSTLNATWMISSVLAGLHRTARPITYSRKSMLPSWFCEEMGEINSQGRYLNCR